MTRPYETTWQATLGATIDDEGVRFRVWAPASARVDVVFYDGEVERVCELRPESGGYYSALVKDAAAGARYRFRLDGGHTYPDPSSRSQPDGVHGPSEVVDPGVFPWTDNAWDGLSPEALVIYELHIGTFTPEGTFDAAIRHLDDLRALGISAVEVMPVASFPGTRNWGYDGVALFAPAAPYGGPDGFRRFVDASHARGMGVILDVVYNHLGPEGNYLTAVTGGHFFTSRHRTPWGDAVNYDGPESGPVRDFIVQNALHWAHEYHIDGLRLDATHAILDDSPTHILREIADRLHALTPPRVLIAEDDRNERRIVVPPDEGGFGFDAVWADELHHVLRRLAAGDSEGYFASYRGTIDEAVAALEQGWLYEGQYDEYHGAPRGTPPHGLAPRAFVHCLQNHDQVGNRAMGDRLTASVSLAVYRALSALLLLSPYTPLLWMGQEWAASTPFRYFTDHPEPLGQAVTEGRREEFRHFSAFADPANRHRIPDPQAAATFLASKLRWDERAREPHASTLSLYGALLTLRRNEPALRDRSRTSFAVERMGDRALALRRTSTASRTLLVVVHLGEEPLTVRLGDGWGVLLDTEERRFGGSGSIARLRANHAATMLERPGAGAVVLHDRA
jgi:maltooligosyltrehalose trehalohydrolase